MIEDLDLVDKVEVSSFDHDKLARVHTLNSRISTGALFSEVPHDYIEVAKRCKASEIHLRYDTCSTDRVSECHKNGFEVMAWFRGPLNMREDSFKFDDCENEDKKMYEIVMLSGCDSICVNRPSVALDALKCLRSY